MQEKSDRNASSAQPASKEFQNKYEYLSTHYESAIGIHISQALSGTFSSSEKGSKDVIERTGVNISVINSNTLSAGLGLIVLRAARALEGGADHTWVLNQMEEWKAKSIVRVSVPTLKYIVRSGRVSPLKSFIARMLDLKPVINVNAEGKTELFSKSFTRKGSLNAVIKSMRNAIQGKEVWEYAITHANNTETANFYAAEMERLTGKKPVFIDHASPAIAANTGPGVACIAVMLK
jgi:DegV family protein with EDD domain